jgi:cell division protein FtsZ
MTELSEDLLEVEADRRRRAAPGLPPRRRPGAADAGGLDCDEPCAVEDRGFVAPKAPPAGAPTPEALARLRDAIQREAPRPVAAAPPRTAAA